MLVSIVQCPTEDEMFGWHHWLNWHEFGWTAGVGDGQGGLVCCGSWGHKESDMTEQLNWTEMQDQLHLMWLLIKEWASLVAQLLKNLPAVQETWVLSLGWEDPLEKKMATHSSILAWKISWTEEPDGLQSMGSQRVGRDWASNTYLLTNWRTKAPQ